MKLVAKRDSKTGKYGFACNGNIVVPYVYSIIADSWNCGMIYVKRDGWRGFLDENADERINLESYVEESVPPRFVAGLCRLIKKDVYGIPKVGCINTSGYEVIPFVYDFGDFVKYNKEGVLLATSGNFKGLVSAKGVLADLSDYNCNVKDFNQFDGLYFVSKVGKYGVNYWGGIDVYGNTRIPFAYETLVKVTESLIGAGKGGKYGLLNLSGKEVTPAMFDGIMPFYCGRAAVCKKHLWGFIDESGSWVVQPAFKMVKNYHDNRAWVSYYDSMKWKLIDVNGFFVEGVEYDDVKDFS